MYTEAFSLFSVFVTLTVQFKKVLNVTLCCQLVRGYEHTTKSTQFTDNYIIIKVSNTCLSSLK